MIFYLRGEGLRYKLVKSYRDKDSIIKLLYKDFKSPIINLSKKEL